MLSALFYNAKCNKLRFFAHFHDHKELLVSCCNIYMYLFGPPSLQQKLQYSQMLSDIVIECTPWYNLLYMYNLTVYRSFVISSLVVNLSGSYLKLLFVSFQDAIIKTLITAHPILKHNYRTCFPNHNKGSACFEILGFDILLDKKLKAWVLEVTITNS